MFACTDCCGYHTTRKDYLNAHQRSHLGFHVHVCEADGCTGVFLKAATLVKHVREVHVKVKAYCCDVAGCSYSSATKLLLYEHMKRHFGIKLYHCTLCDSTFAKRQQLVRHGLNLHGMRPPPKVPSRHTLLLDIAQQTNYINSRGGGLKVDDRQ